MTWTVFRHNFGPNETHGSQTRSGQYAFVVVQTDEQTAIDWWEKRFDADPTRYDGWPDTTMEKAWNINEIEDEEALLDSLDDIEVESEAIGAVKSRPSRMQDIQGDDKTLVMQTAALREDEE